MIGTHVCGMGDDRLCGKSSIFKSLFLVLLCLITIQIAFNLSIEQAALKFMSRWVEVSEQLYVASSSRLRENFGRETDILKDTLSTALNQNVETSTIKYKDETYVCNNNSTNSTEDCLPLCPEIPPKLVGLLATYTDAPKYSELERLFPWVDVGGRGKPAYCHPRHRVAIIIPYRNRDSQLRTFLYNIHPILYRQELDYGIYVVEQNGTSRFNRAMLMNIGYAEASKIYDYQCYIFHDVDLIPENDRNIYSCPKQPRHMSVAIDKFKYRLPYNAIFGGVSALTKEQFKKVNGFPNRYFGWGGEDDDMWNRIGHAGYKVTRYAMDIARYKMIKHGTESGNKANPTRFKYLKEWKNYIKTDGINNLHYKVLEIKYNHLFTKITVDINEDEVMKNVKKS